MTIQPPKNPNYCATVVRLSAFVELPNCDNVKTALIFGNSIIVSKDCAAGDLGLFFPVETALSKEFLGENNLYRKAEWGNQDATKTGFFEQHGRVRAMKFRGHKSAGFWIPMSSLDAFFAPELPEGTSFDAIGDIEICRKYVPAGRRGVQGVPGTKGRQPKLEDSIVDGQFRFHFDTANLRRNAHRIEPDDMISITDKWHGTSIVLARVLVKRPLRLHEKLLRRFGVAIHESAYGTVYSSRRVIKAVNGIAKQGPSFYSADIYGAVAREVEGRIPDGFTVYGEVVGYTPDGGAIQQGYTYGCKPGEHRLLVYRVTATLLTGGTVELAWPQVLEFCAIKGFEPVRTIFWGRASDLLPRRAAAWTSEDVVEAIALQYANDGDCPFNPKGTPAEGVVVRIDRLSECEAYKLKNFRFLERESKALDTGALDIETAESEGVA